MDPMKWRRFVRRWIVGSPRDRWAADGLFIVLGGMLGLWVAQERESIVSGIAVAAVVLALDEFLFHFLVRRRSGRGPSD